MKVKSDKNMKEEFWEILRGAGILVVVIVVLTMAAIPCIRVTTKDEMGKEAEVTIDKKGKVTLILFDGEYHYYNLDSMHTDTSGKTYYFK